MDLESKIIEVQDHIDHCNNLLNNTRYCNANAQYIHTIERMRDHHVIDLEILQKALTIVNLKRRKKYWRDHVLIRDDFTCKRCGGKLNLTVHHIIPRWTCTTDMKWAEYNGVVLCVDCHRLWHDEYKATDNIRLFLQWLNNTPMYKH